MGLSGSMATRTTGCRAVIDRVEQGACPIDGIASQTALLALDAATATTRAGGCRSSVVIANKVTLLVKQAACTTDRIAA